MLFEEAPRNPLVDGISDVLDKFGNASFVLFLSSLDGFEEELDEAFQGVLVHVVDDTKGDTQEVEHGSFSSHWTINLPLGININFCFLSLLGLLLN